MKKSWFILILCLCLLLSACVKPNTPDTPPQESVDNPAQEPGKLPSQDVADGCAHVDEHNDGRCDLCNEIVIVAVDLYSINDLHGKVADGDTHPGVDELTTYLERERELNDHVVLLSDGDMWQGSAESNLTKGLLVTDWMNEMDFASMTLGNHEYDWGEEPILTNDVQAEFPFLAINIYDRETNTQVDYCQSSIVVERGGVQIGIRLAVRLVRAQIHVRLRAHVLRRRVKT